MRTSQQIRAALGLAGVLALMLGASAGAPFAAAQTQPSTKVAPRVLRDLASNRNTSLVILLADQADLRSAALVKDPDAQGRLVYETLKDHADRTQAGLRAWLLARGVAYRAYWAANALVVEGDRLLVDALATRPDVRAIEANTSVRGIEDPAIAQGTSSARPAAPAVAEWGVQNVNAPQVWDLGFFGQGIVIGNQDTGIEWSHAALQPQYRGSDPVVVDHNYNWHDAIHNAIGNPCGNDSPVPCDDNGHGTHTTGTTSGDDGLGNQIGVAPGARWIGCRNMDRGDGTPERYMECFEFFIAPTDLSGINPDPTLRAHVINNSWGCPPSEGCAPNTLATVVENAEAAGIFVVVSAGNSGPTCESVETPPAIYAASFSVGAYDAANNLAAFSSRGPVTVDASNRRKPDISAPGVAVRSSVRGNSYGLLSGTSMAGPHVVGAVALLWSARPELVRDIPTTRAVLQNSAQPNVLVVPPQACGGTPSTSVPNNSFGYGRVDALAAVTVPSPARSR
jgi:subtilisin family serine protease